jgi:hypothetical protein
MVALAAAAGAAGEVLVEGLIWLCGIATLAVVGEKVAEISVRKADSDFCCGFRRPSGKFNRHFILKKTRKEAEEVALHCPGADGAEHHTGTDADVRPHFHPTMEGTRFLRCISNMPTKELAIHSIHHRMSWPGLDFKPDHFHFFLRLTNGADLEELLVRGIA